MSGDMYGAYPENFYGNHNEWPNPPQFNSNPRTWSHPNSASREVEFNSVHMNPDEYGGGFDVQSVDTGWSKFHGPWNGRSSGYYSRGPQGSRHMRQRGNGNKRFNGTGRNQPSSGNHFCDSCDRGFPTADDLQSHCQNDHIICGLDGCTLSAHPKIMEKHQKMQHATGLYSRIASVFSQNPEEVKKWIADRKKNYPTKENIERRKQEEDECMERGESLGLRRGGGSRFGRHRGMNRSRGRGRGGLGRGNQQEPRKPWTGGNNEVHKKKWNRKTNRNSRQKRDHEFKAPPEEKMEDEENPMGIPMFPGTASILGIALEKCQTSDEEIEDAGAFSDMEWIEEKKVIADATESETISESTCKEEPEAKNNSITITNALGFLMGTYASDDSDEESTPVEIKLPLDRRRALGNKNNSQEEKMGCDLKPDVDKPSSCRGNDATSEESQVDKEKKKEEEEGSDCSAPEEISTVKRAKVEEGKGVEENGEEGGEEGKEKGSNSGKEGGIKRSRRCKKRGRSKGSAETGKEVCTNKKPVFENLKRKTEVARVVQKTSFPTLLEELLKNEIRHERNVILQCIRYVVQNNFFDPSNVVVAEMDPKTNENVEEPVIIEPQEPSSEVDKSVNVEHESTYPETCNNLTTTLENNT